MHIAIIGAGYSGLTTANTLLSFGHSVDIFDASPDVGGVWSSVNHYPGLRSQNDKDSYAFSTLPMPKSYPTHPSGQQIQAYLESYARRSGLYEEGRLKLGTKVIRAEQTTDGWVLEVESKTHGVRTLSFDYLICATGVFSQPYIPSFPGIDDFVQGGGTVIHTSDFHRLPEIKHKDVIIVGFGKSACDTALASTTSAKSTTIIARDVIWKLPTYVGGMVHYSYLLLTRFGESLFPYIQPTVAQRSLHDGIASPIRVFLLATLSFIISIQLKLSEFNLMPNKPFATIARSSVSLATPGFVQALNKGKLQIERDVTITSLQKDRKVILSNGKTLSADMVICGTGWTHHIPSFLPQGFKKNLLNSDGDWALYKHILPIDIPNLAFVGFNSSIFCPLTAEITSIWLAAHLENVNHLLVKLPSKEEQRSLAETEVKWHRHRTDGHHANGTSIVPFSLSNIEEMLKDLGVGISWFSWLREWLLPVDPAAYRHILPTVMRRRDILKAYKEKVA